LRILSATGVAGLVGCGPEESELLWLPRAANDDCTVTMYDMRAIALYYDGTQGPDTGVISVDYVLAAEQVDLDFWHGHGGQLHAFSVLPEHFEQLKAGERVYIETTEVQSHAHMLFIDPVDPDYRVPGAEPVDVPICDPEPTPEPSAPPVPVQGSHTLAVPGRPPRVVAPWQSD
jgi:hypothetical protein